MEPAVKRLASHSAYLIAAPSAANFPRNAGCGIHVDQYQGLE